MGTLNSCSTKPSGLGGGDCLAGNPLSAARKIIPAIPGFSFASYSAFTTLATWNEGIAAENLFPLTEIAEREAANEEEIIVSSSSGDKFFRRNGVYGAKLMLITNAKQNQLLKSYNNKNLDVFIVDENHNVHGRTPEGTTVKGFTTSLFRVSDLIIPMTTEEIAYSVINIQFANNYEFNNQIVTALSENFEWNAVEDLVPITEMVAVEVAPIATETFTASFNFVNDRIASNASEAFTGGVDVDFLVKDQAGTTVSPISVIESLTIPGNYVFVCTGSGIIAGSTVQLIASADSLYKSNELVLTV